MYLVHNASVGERIYVLPPPAAVPYQPAGPSATHPTPMASSRAVVVASENVGALRAPLRASRFSSAIFTGASASSRPPAHSTPATAPLDDSLAGHPTSQRQPTPIQGIDAADAGGSDASACSAASEEFTLHLPSPVPSPSPSTASSTTSVVVVIDVPSSTRQPENLPMGTSPLAPPNPFLPSLGDPSAPPTEPGLVEYPPLRRVHMV
ncbi:hypothetical protein GQ54DRAFT_324316, partial [Martensiomyces pterosporus]